MRCLAKTVAVAAILLNVPGSLAQEAVTPAADADALFTSRDPVLQANKQIVYHIVKDLLGAGHWELAGRYLSERYIQHNPNVPSGRDAIVRFGVSFTGPARPIPDRLRWPVVAVLAEGDLVTVISQVTLADPRHPGQTYTTAAFDMWRIKNGKADEHWDGAPVLPPPAGPTSK